MQRFSFLAAGLVLALLSACGTRPQVQAPVDNSGTLNKARQAQSELSTETGRR